jgi:hypothetical protein
MCLGFVAYFLFLQLWVDYLFACLFIAWQRKQKTKPELQLQCDMNTVSRSACVTLNGV